MACKSLEKLRKDLGSSLSPDCRSQRFEVLTLDKRLLVGE